MQLSPSLKGMLGAVETHLDNPAVGEVLILSPDRALVSSQGKTEEVHPQLTRAKLGSLAERLQKDPSALGEAFSIAVVMGSSSMTNPIVRIVRAEPLGASLQDLARDGALDASAEVLLREATADLQSMIVTGRRASGKTALLAALAREWRRSSRVVVIERAPRLLERAGVGHLALDPEGGLEGAVALGADLIIADDPPPKLLFDLILQGRPFAATIEAGDAMSALMRLEARLFAADRSLSKGSTEALVEAAIDLIVETVRERGRARVKSVLELCREQGTLVARPAVSWRRSLAHGADSTPAFQKDDAAAFVPFVPPPPPATVVVPRPPKSTPRRPLSSPSVRARPGTPTGRDEGRDLFPPPHAATAADPLPPMALDALPVGLDAPAAIAPESPSHPSEVSDVMVFNPSEVSEIRPEQLMSQSFVMSLSEIEKTGKKGSDVVLVDLTGRDDESTLDGQDHPSKLEVEQVARRPESRGASPEAGLADSPSGILASQDLVSPPKEAPAADAALPIEDDVGHEDTRSRDGPMLPALHKSAEQNALDLKKVRREVQERAPTLLNLSEASLSGPSPAAESSANPSDPWAGDFDALKVSDTASGIQSLAGAPGAAGGDPITAGGHIVPPDAAVETHDLAPPGGSISTASASAADPLVADFDATQSARLGEMVSGLHLEGSMTPPPPDEMGLEEGGEVTEGAPKQEVEETLKRRRVRPFEEMTPVWSLLSEKPKPAETPRPSSIDPVRIAAASGEEFDAILEELRDVTNSSFDPDKESTEAAGNLAGDELKDGAPDDPTSSKGKNRIVPSDIKRRTRLR